MQRLVFVLVVSTTLIAGVFAAAAEVDPLLLTSDQEQVQSLATQLLDASPVRAARDAAIRSYLAAPPARLADGRSSLVGAVDELVYGVVLAIANDPSDPKVVWNQVLPYDSGTLHVTGARYGADDPDRIYRTIAIDPAHQYEIRGRRRPEASLDFSFEAIDGPALWGRTRAVLQSEDVDVAADGSFVLTADATASDGRRNHLQLPAGTANILARDTLADWTRQLPNELSVKRTDQVAVEPRTHAQLVERAAQQVQASVAASLKLIEGASNNPPNHLFPVVRGLGSGVKGGVIAVNRFRIRDDEALVITLDPIGAKYLSIEVADPWLRSTDYQRRSTSLNQTQAQPSADGRFTYVLTRADPGVRNWLDTAGLHDGFLIARWELFSGQVHADRGVREMRIVPLSKLPTSLPAGAEHVTAAQRQQLLAARSASYQRRLPER